MGEALPRAAVAYGYIRLGAGRDRATQEAELLAYVAAHQAGPGTLWGGNFVDHGGRLQTLAGRPAGEALLERLRPGDHVLATDLGSLFTHREDAGHVLRAWREDGVTLHLTRAGLNTGAGVGRHLTSLFTLFCQWQHDVRGEPVREFWNTRGGRRVGGHPPLGYKFVGRGDRRQVVPDVKEQAVIHRVVHLHDEQGYTFPEIHLLLLREKVRTRRGGAWSLSRITAAYHRHRRPAGEPDATPPGPAALPQANGQAPY